MNHLDQGCVKLCDLEFQCVWAAKGRIRGTVLSIITQLKRVYIINSIIHRLQTESIFPLWLRLALLNRESCHV